MVEVSVTKRFTWRGILEIYPSLFTKRAHNNDANQNKGILVIAYRNLDFFVSPSSRYLDQFVVSRTLGALLIQTSTFLRCHSVLVI